MKNTMKLFTISLLLQSLHLLVNSSDVFILQIEYKRPTENSVACLLRIQSSQMESSLTEITFANNSQILTNDIICDDPIIGEVKRLHLQCQLQTNLTLSRILLIDTDNGIYYGRFGPIFLSFSSHVEFDLQTYIDMIKMVHPVYDKSTKNKTGYIVCPNGYLWRQYIPKSNFTLWHLPNFLQKFRILYIYYDTKNQIDLTKIIFMTQNYNCSNNMPTRPLQYMCHREDTYNLFIKTYITINPCEFVIFGMPASISKSKYTGSFNSVSTDITSKIVDGVNICIKTNTIFDQAFQITSPPNKRPSWYVDLGGKFRVTEVIVYHSNSFYLEFVLIEIRIALNLHNSTICATFNGPPIDRYQLHHFHCVGSAQYVIIESKLNNRKLSLCEVEVFGFNQKGIGVWSEWTPFSDCFCDEDYLTPVRRRSRTCNATFLMEDCPGFDVDFQQCNKSQLLCSDPNKGRWSDWSMYSNCSCRKNLEKPVRFRNRTCLPTFIDKDCTGVNNDFAICLQSNLLCSTSSQGYLGIVFVTTLIIFLFLIILALIYKSKKEAYKEASENLIKSEDNVQKSADYLLYNTSTNVAD